MQNEPPTEPVKVSTKWKRRAERVNATRVLRGEKRVPLSSIAEMGFREWVPEEEKRLGIAPMKEQTNEQA